MDEDVILYMKVLQEVKLDISSDDRVEMSVICSEGTKDILTVIAQHLVIERSPTAH